MRLVAGRVQRWKHERGRAAAIKTLLKEQRMSSLHAQVWSPFLLVPKADVECFPMDWLHGMYVPQLSQHWVMIAVLFLISFIAVRG